jgi:hypothetical protein
VHSCRAENEWRCRLPDGIADVVLIIASQHSLNRVASFRRVGQPTGGAGAAASENEAAVAIENLYAGEVRMKIEGRFDRIDYRRP